MKVAIKSFDVQMEVKTNGIEFEVYSPDGSTFHGDFIVTKTGVIWCKGKTTRAKGKKVNWDRVIQLLESEP